MARHYDAKEKTVCVVALLRDFDGGVEKWKDGFYQLWRYQLTYSYAYKIALYENCNDGVFLRLTVRPAYKDNILETMEDLGYREVKTYDGTVGVVCQWDHDDLEDIDMLVYD